MGMAREGCKCLEMTVNGLEWPEMDGNGREWDGNNQGQPGMAGLAYLPDELYARYTKRRALALCDF